MKIVLEKQHNERIIHMLKNDTFSGRKFVRMLLTTESEQGSWLLKSYTHSKWRFLNILNSELLFSHFHAQSETLLPTKYTITDENPITLVIETQ